MPRLAGAAPVVLVALVVVACAARGDGPPVGGGSPISSSASPIAATPSPSPAQSPAQSPAPSPSPPPSPPPSPTPRANPTVTGDTLSGVVAATGATYQVCYAQVGGLDDVAADPAINELLRDQADAAVREFTTGVGKDPQAGPNQPSTLQFDYSVAYSSPDVLSLRVNSYSYPSGPPTAPTC